MFMFIYIFFFIICLFSLVLKSPLGEWSIKMFILFKTTWKLEIEFCELILSTEKDDV